jgi:hypothetical protein
MQHNVSMNTSRVIHFRFDNPTSAKYNYIIYQITSERYRYSDVVKSTAQLFTPISVYELCQLLKILP